MLPGGGRITVAKIDAGQLEGDYHLCFFGFGQERLPSDEIALDTWKKHSRKTLIFNETAKELVLA